PRFARRRGWRPERRGRGRGYIKPAGSILGDEGVGPEALLKVGFRDRFRPRRCQHERQLEGLRREMNFLTCPEQLSGVAVQGEGIELDPHAANRAVTSVALNYTSGERLRL